jgi:HSP20 family protein
MLESFASGHKSNGRRSRAALFKLWRLAMTFLRYELRPGLAWIPSVDVYEEKDRYVVRADLPGVDPKDIDLSAADGVLTVRGERRAPGSDAQQTFERRERVSGSFLRRFTLPEDANADAISAHYANGVLEVGIAKQAKPEPRRITVEAA